MVDDELRIRLQDMIDRTDTSYLRPLVIRRASP
jgi:hypothetical protein